MDDRDGYTQVLYHDDLAGLTPGPVVSSHFRSNDPNVSIRAVSRGLGKYLELVSRTQPVFWLTDALNLAHYRIRAVLIPLSFDGCGPQEGFCGVVAAYRHSDDYFALVISKDRELKLLRRKNGMFELLARAPVDYCIGQPLTLALTIREGRIEGMAGPYSGAVRVSATLEHFRPLGGDAGLICAAETRFGPHTVECRVEDLALHEEAKKEEEKRRSGEEEKTSNVSAQPRLLHQVPLHGLVHGPNLQCADLNGDGQPEFIVAQSAREIAESISLTRLTCLSVLSQDGTLLWQAGVPSLENKLSAHAHEQLPFSAHALYGDPPVIVCVFGYDVQIRDGKTGRLLASAKTPETFEVSNDFKTLAPRVVDASGKRVWGDEVLNMDAARVSFCDTLGNGAKREIVIADALHNLAVLDVFAEPVMTALFRHRGNLGGEIWSGDLDGDGKDELLAGCSLLDDDGRLIDSLPLGGAANGVVVLEADEAAGMARRICVYSVAFGLFMFNAETVLGKQVNPLQIRGARVGNFAPRQCVAGRFAAEIPGAQLALVEGETLSRVILLDASGARLWTVEFNRAVRIQAVRTPSGELLLVGWNGGFAALDGSGKAAFRIDDAGIQHSVVLRDYNSGFDAVAAFNSQTLKLYALE